MLVTRGFSLTNFVIGTSALSFQIFVLYPWHEKLEEQFLELKKEHVSMLRSHGEELAKIREQIDGLKTAKEAKGGRWF